FGSVEDEILAEGCIGLCRRTVVSTSYLFVWARRTRDSQRTTMGGRYVRVGGRLGRGPGLPGRGTLPKRRISSPRSAARMLAPLFRASPSPRARRQGGFGVRAQREVK